MLETLTEGQRALADLSAGRPTDHWPFERTFEFKTTKYHLKKWEKKVGCYDGPERLETD